MAKRAGESETKIEAFKGFDKDLRCNGFQYEVGKTYKMDSIAICARGFHSCENPLDVWGYYDVAGSRFALVEATGEIQRNKDGDSKLCSAEITIKAELTLPEYIKRAVSWMVEATKGSSGEYAQIGSSGDCAQIGSSGNFARIGSSGHSAQIGSSDYSAQIGSSGDSARIGSSGDYTRIGSSGDSARIGSSGDYTRIGSSGNSAQIGSSGDCARIGSSGDCARIGVEGKDSVVAAAGYATQTKGPDGTWVSLAEFSNGECVGFATGCIGKDGLKPDTWYAAKGGKLVEAA